jgi:hypothetical protein
MIDRGGNIMKISNIIPPITKRPIPGIPVPKFPWPFGWNEVIYIVEKNYSQLRMLILNTGITRGK